jgi:glycolate oxidase iron-sulfur subunit
MLHSIPSQKHGPLSEPMIHAVESCVHCGFCLAACPTYHELGQEMDTPRGRIVLMKQVLEGSLSWSKAQPHVERCLGCLACEPACPSGVPYRDLISPFRALARENVPKTIGQRVQHWLLAQTVPFPHRFRWAARIGLWTRSLARFAPAALQPMMQLLPSSLPQAVRWPERTPALGERRARVALLLGCGQQVLMPDINSATIAVLSMNGVEVIIPRGQGCCGTLAWHAGDLRAAQTFARRNLRAFPNGVDAIITNAAGCGSALHEYHRILRGTSDEHRAEALARRAVDVAVFLEKLGLRPLPHRQGLPRRVVYHDACHLANAQNVRAEPRALLKAIPGVELIELADEGFCCGSAGSYNLDQPRIAASLGRRKAKAILATGADMVVSGNIGCLMQLEMHLRTLGSSLPVRHTIQLLRDAYASQSPLKTCA